MPNMLPLYDFKHPRIPHKRGGANLNKIQSAIALNGHRIRPKGPKRSWWSLSGSNRRPEACKATALPAELRPHLGSRSRAIHAGARSGLRRSRVEPAPALLRRPTGRRRRFGGKPRPRTWPPAFEAPMIMVGLGRLERPTSPLSGVRSNHLSYRPEPHPKAAHR